MMATLRHFPLLLALLHLLAVVPFPFCYGQSEQLSDYERNRRLEYMKRGYEWPITNYNPTTKGWKELMDHRFRQIAEIKDGQGRYEGYAQTISSALVQPNFTQYGFGLARAPESLMKDLRQAIHDGVEDGNLQEENIDGKIIEGGKKPWFIERPDLTERVLKELHHYPEIWSGIDLTPVIAYGFRLYRNDTSLNMHVDKSNTHIISFILHIDSSDDSEPWPIMIEDLNGNTHEVVLTSGDMLFYESSKCFHGRPRKFRGSWYTSIFVHYHPTYYWFDQEDENGNNVNNLEKIKDDVMKEKLYAVPNHWNKEPTTHYEIPLEMISTTMKEPNCPNNWCNSEYSIKWSGPGIDGYWIAPTGQKYKFNPAEPLMCKDWDEEQCNKLIYESDDGLTPTTVPIEIIKANCKRHLNYTLSHCKQTCNAC